MPQCKICGNSENNKTLLAQERMFGFGSEFEYLECSNCGCIQLLNIPPDMAKYYPQDQYYSLSSGEKFTNKKSLSNTIRKNQSDYLLFGKKRFIGSKRWGPSLIKSITSLPLPNLGPYRS